jgi:aminopeptidase-like protein
MGLEMKFVLILTVLLVSPLEFNHISFNNEYACRIARAMKLTELEQYNHGLIKAECCYEGSYYRSKWTSCTLH